MLAVAWSLVASMAASPSPEAAPVLDRILEQSRRVQEADLAAWARYRFQRQVIRERLDPEGKVRDREDLIFRVTPSGVGFDEELILHDGNEPTLSEVKHHRKAARFSKHYLTLDPQGDAEEKDAFSLADLLYLSTYEYVGREILNGIPCHRLDFSPTPGGEGAGIAGRIARAMGGSLWITEDGLHVLQARARTESTVPIGLFLVRITRLEVNMVTHLVAPDVWLPLQIEVRTDARVVGVANRKRNTYRYSDFVPTR